MIGSGLAIWLYSPGDASTTEQTPGTHNPGMATTADSNVTNPVRKSVPPTERGKATAKKGDSDEVIRLMSGRCVDGQGFPLDGTMLIEPLEPPAIPSREVAVVNGFFECKLPGNVFRGDYAKVFIGSSTHVAYAGPLRIATGLVVPVRSVSASSIAGKITVFEASLREWSVKVFFTGSSRMIAQPYPQSRFKRETAEVRMPVFEPANLSSDRPVALILLEGIAPIQRVKFQNLRSLRDQVQQGLELRPVVHRFHIPKNPKGGPIQSIYFIPVGWEFDKPRKLAVRNGYCEGAFGVGSYIVRVLESGDSRMKAARVELAPEDHHGSTNIVWEEVSTQTSDVVITVTTPDSKPVGGAFIVARSLEPGSPGLVERRATTDSDGRVTLPELPSGNYRFFVQSKLGRFHARPRVEVPTEEVVIVVKELLTLNLNLRPAVPELADAVETGRIWFRRVGTSRWREWQNQEETFVPRLGVAEAGEYEIAVSTSASMVGSARATAPCKTLIDVRLELVSPVKGVVETRNGESSVAGFRVAFGQSDTRKLLPWEFCIVDKSGGFSLLSKVETPRLVVFGKDLRLRDSHVRTEETKAGEEYLRVVVK
jgi:hypothetical protein